MKFLFQFLLRLWSCKWSMLRLTIALGTLLVLVTDNSGRLARVQFNNLPEMDYLTEVKNLKREGRFAEALMVAKTGLAELKETDRDALAELEKSVEEEQQSLIRRGKELLRGALVGEGDSLEALIGAVGADMLVIGDVRDLVIQGGKFAVDGDSDELILVLSAVGLLTTVMPEVDWVAAFLKVAKKAGALSKRMVEAIVRVVRRALDSREYGDLRRLFGGFQLMVERATPAGALRIMRHLDDPKDVEKVAGFLRRQSAGGFALHVAGKEGVDLVKGGARASEELLVQAAKKGDAGVAWLRSGAPKLLRPHLIVGVLKGVKKGNVQRAVARIAASYDPYGWLVIPLCAAWTFFESAWLWRRLLSRPAAA